MRNVFGILALVGLMCSSNMAAAANPSPSISGTTVPSASQIVDGQGATWIISTGGQAYRNGAATPSYSVKLLLYYNGVVYQENTSSDWYQWGGNLAWTATSDPRVVSASSTTIPFTTQIVDSKRNIWTLIDGVAYENGATTPSSGVTLLLYADSIVYQENIHNDWWEWTSGAWVAASAPAVVSSNGTVVGNPTVSGTFATATQILDSQGATWIISTGGQAYRNGAATPSYNVKLLLYYNGVVYEEGTAGDWYQWSSGAWAATSNDPRVPTLAANAGYKTLTFNSTVVDMNSGPVPGKWQTSSLNGIGGSPAVQNGDGSFTVNGQGTAQAGVATAIKNTANGSWTGMVFKPGMYIKVVMSYTGVNAGATSGNNTPSWPAFWGTSIDHAIGATSLDQWLDQPTGYEHWLEADFWEAYCGTETGSSCNGTNSTGTNTGKTTFIDWYGMYNKGEACPNGYCNLQQQVMWNLSGNGTWAAQHTLEFVWVPATSTKNGSFMTYVDGVNVGTNWTWTLYEASSPPPPVPGTTLFSIGDAQYIALIADGGIDARGGTIPLTVYSVEVWQASTAGVLSQ